MRLSILLLLAALLIPQGAPVAAPLNSIAAVVNGEMITAFDLQAEMAPEMLRMGLDPQNPDNRARLTQLSHRVLDTMINNILLTQEAQRLQITASESDVDEEVRELMERGRLTPSEFQRQLQVQGLTEKALRERLAKNLLRQRLLGTMVGRKVVVTREEIAAYYEEHRNLFKSNQSVHFAVLVYPPNFDAEKMADRIKSGKVAFEKAVREVSVGPRASEGGDIGSVPWNDLDPSWKEYLVQLEPGQVSPVFEANGLKTQVKVLELLTGEEQSLEDVSEQIENILREPKLQERFEEYTSQLRKRAMIDIRL